MEIILLFIVLVGLFWIGGLILGNRKQTAELREELRAMRREMKAVSASQEGPKAPSAEVPKAAPGQVWKAPSPVREAPPVTPVQEAPPVPVFPTGQRAAAAPPRPPITVAPPVTAPPVGAPPADPGPGFFRRWLQENPDMERFIGENLASKIGIGILVLGIAFFVKYAIDQEWIGEIGRVCIGFFCGAILVGLAHRLRKGYHSFSSILVGGGLCVFYFTVAFAFHQYKLIGQGTAFTAMVVITIFAILLSVFYDRIELGVVASLGGFVTPFLVSNGTGDYVILFTYLCILNAGLIILAYYKRWRLLNFIAFVFTETIYLGWIVGKAGTNTFPYMGTFIFGLVFYTMFLAMNVVHHAIKKSPLKAFDFIILLSVNLTFYGAGIYLLQKGGYESMKGLFTLCLGVINLSLAYLFFRQKTVDKNFVYLLLGITLSFLSLAAPVQLKGNYITLFWATETVVLFWLYQKSFIRLIKVASVLITILMLISLFMDWAQVYNGIGAPPPIIVNKGCVTALFCAACMFLYYRMAIREGDLYFIGGITNRLVRGLYLGAGLLLVFGAGILEINEQFSRRLPGTGFNFLYLQLFCIAFFIAVLALLKRIKLTYILAGALVLFIAYLANAGSVHGSEVQVLNSGLHRGWFFANWISAGLLLWLGWQLLGLVRKDPDALKRFSWILAVGVVVVLSIETGNGFVWLYYNGAPSSIEAAEAIFGKAGLSILWGVCAFVFIAVGISHRYKPLRIIALVLFGITLLKLFFYDISNISPAGKIIAFILLGVLLLIISFMYQRLKKMLLNDPEKDA